MAVTSQQIADAAGVSRGTVDRALNNRGRINPEVADKIKKIADEMGYRPNRAGRALVMSKRAIKIGIVIQAAHTPFMKRVLEGALEAKMEIESFGASVIVREINCLDAGKAVEAMYEMKEQGCNGIAVVPVDDEQLKETIDAFAKENIYIVTFNSDIEESKRLCFVGQDAYQSGKAAAGLMAEILPKGGHVLIISGYPTNRSHKNRTKGFSEEFADCRKDCRVLAVQYAFDDDKMAEMITSGMLGEYEDLMGIYLAASGVSGVCAALEKKGLTKKVKVISNDLTEQNIQYLKAGKIRFLIGQDSFRQGYEPLILLFDKLLDGKNPENEFVYTEIVIKTKYNIE